MQKPLALPAVLLLGCASTTATTGPVVDITVAPPAPIAPAAEVPFQGSYTRYAKVSFKQGRRVVAVNARGQATLRVDRGKVVYEQVYPLNGRTVRVTQVYSFEADDLRPSGDGVFETPLIHRSMTGDTSGFAPDKRSPWLQARKQPWGWDLALMAIDTQDVLAAAAFGAAPPGQPPPDVTAYARRVGAELPAPPPATSSGEVGTAAPPDVGAPPPTATRTASGLAYRFLKRGKGGRSPTGQSTVLVHYTGWTTDGAMFDSSVARGQPTLFALHQVIKGWTEGVQLMRVGDVARFWMPPDLAYGQNPRGGAPAGMLVFDVELLDVR